MESLALDDTGSSILSLNCPKGLFLLGYQPGETMPVNTVEVETANGKASRNTTSVQINFKDSNGAYLGWESFYCLLNPGLDETRLSGM